MEYRDGVPVRVHTVVVSAQHASDVSLSTIREDVISQVIQKSIPPEQ